MTGVLRNRRRHRPVTLLCALAAVPLLGLLAGCGDDEQPDAGPPTVELGEEFVYDDFRVAEGWELASDKQMMGTDEVVKPLIRANATNEGDEARFALFEVVFGAEGDPVSTIHCRSLDRLEPGATGPLICDGIGQPVPEDYDRIVVRPITR